MSILLKLQVNFSKVLNYFVYHNYNGFVKYINQQSNKR